MIKRAMAKAKRGANAVRRNPTVRFAVAYTITYIAVYCVLFTFLVCIAWVVQPKEAK